MNALFRPRAAAAIFALGFLFAGGVSHAQRGGAQQTEFAEMSHDFGKINEVDGPVSHTFGFKNTSNRPYVIDFVSVSCGCTTPQYDKAPVLPGREGSITVTFDPAGRPGVFDKSIVVTGNNRRERTVLTITGEVAGRPRSVEEIYPYEIGSGLRAGDDIIVFGYVARGRNATRAVELYNGGGEPAHVMLTAASNKGGGFYTASVDPAVIPPGGKAQLSFTYDLREKEIWGVVQTKISFNVNGKGAADGVTAFATVTDDFSGMTAEQLARAPLAEISSQYYYVGDVKRGDVITQAFEVKNTGEDPLLIKDLHASGDAVKASADRLEIPKGEKSVITVKVDTRGLATGRISEGATLILNDPARPMREVRVSAIVR